MAVSEEPDFDHVKAVLLHTTIYDSLAETLRNQRAQVLVDMGYRLDWDAQGRAAEQARRNMIARVREHAQR